ncbi:MAG TPA: wax ester/triacylglycerol synthase family O-acyltransferase [Solirubrobacteraceae bacterium]|nr:wax ester/triacylglycerol synthase family O-acyltransferase [Solirubrobacteraceae bacterium]
MPNIDRLTALDSSFLHLERDSAHMHVASCMVFEGEPPPYEELLEAIEHRLHLVPRYRQRLAFVPLQQGRPVWVDDPHFNAGYHVRHTALPAPGNDAALRRLAGRVFSQQLDRSKPLWEIWLVQELAPDERGAPRFALLAKTHHALVDGISGVDITTVLFDATADPSPTAEPSQAWVPRPPPSDAQLLADALLERATVPAEIVRGLRSLLRGPRQVLDRFAQDVGAIRELIGAPQAPQTCLNQRIGPHRRFTWVRSDLTRFKQIKNDLGGTVNDVVLTVVSLALGRYLRRHGEVVDGLELRAMVPVSVRSDSERGALGNKVATMWAPLPVSIEDPVESFRLVHEAMAGLKESRQAIGAQVLTDLTGFAPPTIMAQAARLQARQRYFNLTVTNVPGPQMSLYLLGRRLSALHPMVPLAQNVALGIAIMSYDGQLSFGLNGDYDTLADIEDLADDLRAAIAVVAEAAAEQADGAGELHDAVEDTAAEAGLEGSSDGSLDSPAENAAGDGETSSPGEPTAHPSGDDELAQRDTPPLAFSMPRSRASRSPKRDDSPG